METCPYCLATCLGKQQQYTKELENKLLVHIGASQKIIEELLFSIAELQCMYKYKIRLLHRDSVHIDDKGLQLIKALKSAFSITT